MARTTLYSHADKQAYVKSARDQLRAGVDRKTIALHLGVKLTSLNVWLREHTLSVLYPPVSGTMPRNRAT